jgi:hypothetical protein
MAVKLNNRSNEHSDVELAAAHLHGMLETLSAR